MEFNWIEKEFTSKGIKCADLTITNSDKKV